MGSAKNAAIPFDLVRKPISSQEKIKTLEELSNISMSARDLGKKVILAHGVFDLVQIGGFGGFGSSIFIFNKTNN